MLTQLIAHNSDIKQLFDENYDISIVAGHILIKNIPYVNKDKKICFGAIFCSFTMNSEEIRQNDHTVYFVGEWPCDQHGSQIKSFVHSEKVLKISDEIQSSFYFSSRPQEGRYRNFHHKLTRYIDLLSAPAISIDPGASQFRTGSISLDDDGIFRYFDTFTSRAGITEISSKMKGHKVAIIGLGGTGSYLLDFISKTPVSSIALFDEDVIENHNAFRMPSAMSLEELKTAPTKVSYFQKKYSVLRHGIESFDFFIDKENVEVLGEYDFVFMSLDAPDAKKCIIDFLTSKQIPFVDLGMGLSIVDGTIRGCLRQTLVTPDQPDFKNKIPMDEPTEEDVYSSNIQISELNALNAIMGIIAWKKYLGVYTVADEVLNSALIIDEMEFHNEA